jgi:hypothetical protein
MILTACRDGQVGIDVEGEAATQLPEQRPTMLTPRTEQGGSQSGAALRYAVHRTSEISAVDFGNRYRSSPAR